MRIKNGRWALGALAGMLAACMPVTTGAQEFPAFVVPLVAGADTLSLSQAGGLNAPQLSAADLNHDGVEDLYIFDRGGNVHLTFINHGTAGMADYRFAPEYAQYFPDLVNWVLLRDYNGDGIQDIFAYSDIPGIDGITVYRGFYAADTLRFERLDLGAPFNLLTFPSSSGGRLQVFVSNIDIPAVVDIDCDEDLDILTFNLAGGYVEWYRNVSVESQWGRDTLVYELADRCWGGFFESGISSDVTLASAPDECAGDDARNLDLRRHTGSTLLTLDVNGDDLLELVLGDLSFNNLNLLVNAGTCANAWMNAQDLRFPDPDHPVDLTTFPAAFYLDLDNDGLEDIAVAPNARKGVEDRQNLWFYKNHGPDANDRLQFEFVQTDLLVDDMLDLGTGAMPAFLDFNADGLTDLLVGNVSEFSVAGQNRSRLVLFLNTGTKTVPVFTLADDNLFGFSALGPDHYSFVPAAGDLDSDGDTDLLLGTAFGALIYVENSAGPGLPFTPASVKLDFQGLDVGLASAPAMVDVDGDGLTDLLVGERTGNINFFRNVGAVGAPQFTPTQSISPNVEQVGGILTRAPGFLTGHSTPAPVYQEGAWNLLTGSEEGRISYYGLLSDSLAGQMPLLDAFWSGQDPGFRTRPALADLDDDGYYEVAIGNERGGLAFFRTDLKVELVTRTVTLSREDDVKVFPLPARERIYLDWGGKKWPRGRYELFNSQGLTVGRSGVIADLQHGMPLAGLPPGVYYLRLLTDAGVLALPVIVQ